MINILVDLRLQELNKNFRKIEILRKDRRLSIHKVSNDSREELHISENSESTNDQIKTNDDLLFSISRAYHDEMDIRAIRHTS